MTLWVSNTSPLVFLAHLDRLALLQAEGRRVCIPRAVRAEVAVRRDKAEETVARACSEWIDVRDLLDRRAVELLLADLDLGEAEAVVLAKETGAEWLVVDDLEARRFATRAGIPVIGTLGLLVAAKLRGAIHSLREETEKLNALGFHIRREVVAAALARAGELP